MGGVKMESLSNWVAASTSGPLWSSFFFCGSGQPLRNVWEYGDNPSVVNTQDLETPYLVLDIRGWSLPYGLQFFGARSYSSWRHNMTHAPHFLLKELNFSGLSFRWASRNNWNTFRRLCKCSRNVKSITIMSSRYMRHNSWGPLTRFPSDVERLLERCRSQGRQLIRWERRLFLIVRV
jgi:hypothetical protein